MVVFSFAHLDALQLAGGVVVVLVTLHAELPDLHEVRLGHLHLLALGHVAHPHLEARGHGPGVAEDLEPLHGGPGVQGEGDRLGEDAVLGRHPALGPGPHLHQLRAAVTLVLAGHLATTLHWSYEWRTKYMSNDYNVHLGHPESDPAWHLSDIISVATSSN